jgi:hypothetical protein
VVAHAPASFYGGLLGFADDGVVGYTTEAALLGPAELLVEGRLWTLVFDGITPVVGRPEEHPLPDPGEFGLELPCVPVAEAANGLDDDCNGIIDDVPALPSEELRIVEPARGPVGDPALSVRADAVGLAWTSPDGRALFRTLSPDGRPRGDELEIAARTAGDVALDGVGLDWFAWFTEVSEPAAPRLRGAEGDANGFVLGADPGAAGTTRPKAPDVARGPAGVGLAWLDDTRCEDGVGCTPLGHRRIFFQALAADGTPRGAPRIASPFPDGEDDAPAVAATAGGFALAWIHRPSAVARAEVYFLRLAVDGTPQGAPLLLRVLATPDAPGHVDLAPAADGYALAFTDGADQSDLFVAALDAAGARRGADLLVAPREHAAARPVLAPLPAGLAVAWIGTDDALAVALLTADGTAIDGLPAVVGGRADRARTPALVHVGDHLLLAFADDRDGPASALYLRRITLP